LASTNFARCQNTDTPCYCQNLLSTALNDSVIAVAGKKSLKEIDKMKGLDFELFIGDLLTQHGYKTQNIKGSGDFGVDVIAEKGNTKYAVQVKRYKSNVSRTAISDAVAGKFHWDCEKAWVITNSYFTSDAKLLAKSTDCKLTDRDELKNMMKDGSTFASIFEGGADQKRRPFWRRLRRFFFLIGLAALTIYVISFVPRSTIYQFWDSTKSFFSSTNSVTTPQSNDSSSSNSSSSDASSSDSNNANVPIILDTGDSLRPTPIMEGSIPITDLNPSTPADINSTLEETTIDLEPINNE